MAHHSMTMSLFPFSFLSFSFIYYFIYNPSTANSFRPMGALNIFGRYQKNVCNSTRGSFTNLIMCWWLDEDHLNKWPVGSWSAVIKLNCVHDCLCEGWSMWHVKRLFTCHELLLRLPELTLNWPREDKTDIVTLKAYNRVHQHSHTSSLKNICNHLGCHFTSKPP